MIAKPSIAFNDFAGTAKDVTARSVNGRNVLSVRAYQNKVVTPSQAVSRNNLSKISRAFKQLSDSQMYAWAVLSEHLKGISTFGQSAEMTPHNAFVRINSNRALVGMPLLVDAPSYISDIPEPDYQDFWITPERLIFVGIEQPKSTYRLVLRMGLAQSNGVSSGWGNLVIVSPNLVPDWGDVDALELYCSKFGLIPEYGKKYFIEMYWLDTESGFTGEAVRVSSVCDDLSHVRKQKYTPRPAINSEQIGGDPSMPSFDFEMEGDTGIFSLNIDYQGRSGEASAYVKFDRLPEGIKPFTAFVMGRSAYKDYLDQCYSPQTYTIWCRGDESSGSMTVALRGGRNSKPSEIFGSGIMINM